MLDYDFWLRYYIGLFALGATFAILCVILPMAVFFFIKDVIRHIVAKEKDWSGLWREIRRIIWIYTVMFFASYGIYALTTGKTELPYIQVLLSYF